MNVVRASLACSMLLLGSAAAQELRTPEVANRKLSDTASGAVWDYHLTGPPGVEPYGPSDWHLGYPDCGLLRQSPVNLALDFEEIVPNTDFVVEFFPHSCDSTELGFNADNAVWQVLFENCTTQPFLRFQGYRYNLLQIHIHSPSEHMIGGAAHAAEIHFVHLRAGTTDELLVVGVLLDVSDYGSNLEIDNLWKVLGVTSGEGTTTERFVARVYDLLPQNPGFSFYRGSLTTPPCTQGVRWLVMNEITLMGRKQLDAFRDAVAAFPLSKVDEFGNTNRPFQSLNGRPLYYVTY